MFRVGQKVVCVDNTTPNATGRIPNPDLKKGEIYTIAGVYNGWTGPGVTLVELKAREPHIGFHAFRFRPIVERKTDISVFHEILRKATKQADTDIGASA
jgi:hypothetical protein